MSRRALLGGGRRGLRCSCCCRGSASPRAGRCGASRFCCRASERGRGRNGFPVNRTCGGRPEARGGREWLAVEGDGPAICDLHARTTARDAAAHHDLPIACVEGWSTTQRWTRRARARPRGARWGARASATVTAISLEHGIFGAATLGARAGRRPTRTLLALRVNGAELSLDHGYPARIIGPALRACTAPSGSRRCASGARMSGACALAVPRAATARARCTCWRALASFAISGAAVIGWSHEPAISLKNMLIWFAGAIVAHDVRAAARLLGARPLTMIRRRRSTPVAEAARRARARAGVRARARDPQRLLLLVFFPRSSTSATAPTTSPAASISTSTWCAT